MNIFISYSTEDLGLVEQIANYIRPHASVYYWHESKVPGQEAWKTIFSWIEQSDLILTVITDKTVSRAMAVGNEIGHAKAKNKIVIPLVAPDIPSTELGCLSGITYQSIDRENVEPALNVIRSEIISQKKKKEDQQALFWIVMGAVGLLFLSSKK